MDRARLSDLAHAHHPVRAPLGDATVIDLLHRSLEGRSRVLDLGCGDGTWLLRALAMHPALTAVGVDLSSVGFDRVSSQAEAMGVGERLELRCADARTFVPDAGTDAVLSVGASHAFGGSAETLAAVRSFLPAHGVLVYGDGFWERPPGERALTALAAAEGDFGDLASTVARVEAGGWTPLHGHVSTQEEWDDYEWAWTGSLETWARDHPGDPDAAEVRAVAGEHRLGWLEGYRGTLGFVTLVLAPAGSYSEGSGTSQLSTVGFTPA